MERLRKGLFRSSLVILSAGLLLVPTGLALAQQAPPPPPPPAGAGQGPVAQPPANGQMLSLVQLENMVAPIALYPDPLLGQVLAASTYPLEVMQAEQWLQRNSNLQGQALMNAARQQNWDPSVQALVAFPDVLQTLTRDVQWTTDLGNAFLAQQADVMAAVQRLRLRAMQNGRLQSNQQETVTTQNQGDQSAVVIQPADPQVIYVPQYNPAYVWGPPVWGYYPPLFYPPFGFGFYPGIYMGAFFPGWGLGIGFGGWGLGWGWGVGWFGGGLFVNAGFFRHYGFHAGLYGGRLGAGNAWVHDSYHRAGVAYANRSVAARYNNARFAAGRTAAGSSAARSYTARSGVASGARSGVSGRSASGAQSSWRSFSSASRSGTAGAYRGSASTSGAYRGSSNGYSRSYSTPAGRGYGSSTGSRGYSSAARPSSGAYSGRSSGSAPARSSGGGASRSSGGARSSGGGHSGGGGRR